MKISDILIGEIKIPLISPFKTALRTVKNIDDVAIKIMTNDGLCGYGSAAPSAAITGETKESIISVIKNYIKPSIIGMDISDFEDVIQAIHKSIIGNTSAKAAADIALYDLYAKSYNVPLYKLLGGYRKEIKTDITISLNGVEQMIYDSLDAVKKGFGILKVKVGECEKKDIERITEIRKAVEYSIGIRIDGNQAWSPKESVRIIRKLEDLGLEIDLVEQPVAAHDLDGLKFVTDNVTTDILADESVFSAKDAIDIIKRRSADLINIKLMKCGGIYNALKICAIAESYEVGCMAGCMLENKISVSAMAHLACAKKVISMVDLDPPYLCRDNIFEDGPDFTPESIIMSEYCGIGFGDIKNIEFKK